MSVENVALPLTTRTSWQVTEPGTAGNPFCRPPRTPEGLRRFEEPITDPCHFPVPGHRPRRKLSTTLAHALR